MQENIIEKLNLRATKSLTFKEVKLNDINYNDAINYLKNQKLLNFDEINKILIPSSNEDFPIGNILVNKDNKVVGFMGTFYSQKKNNKQIFTLCNIHSWIVDEKFRFNAFFLLSPLLQKNINFSAFTPVKNLVGLLYKFGFKKEIFYYRTLLNLKYFNFINNNFSVNFDINFIKTKLNSEEKIKFNKYNDSIYIKFLIYNKHNSDYIFIVGSKIKKKGLNVFNIFYVSNKTLFKNNWDSFKAIISKKMNIFIFSEYSFNEIESFFPSKQLFTKVSKKNIFLKTNIILNTEDLLNSDLII